MFGVTVWVAMGQKQNRQTVISVLHWNTGVLWAKLDIGYHTLDEYEGNRWYSHYKQQYSVLCLLRYVGITTYRKQSKAWSVQHDGLTDAG